MLVVMASGDDAVFPHRNRLDEEEQAAWRAEPAWRLLTRSRAPTTWWVARYA